MDIMFDLISILRELKSSNHSPTEPTMTHLENPDAYIDQPLNLNQS